MVASRFDGIPAEITRNALISQQSVITIDSMPLMPLLMVEEGPDKGRQFTTETVMFRVGRSEEKCDFVLSDEDSAISREHFAVIRRGDAFLFTNLSRNGSTINGVKAEQTLLKDNDLIRVGLQTVIRFSLQEQRDSNVNPNFG